MKSRRTRSTNEITILGRQRISERAGKTNVWKIDFGTLERASVEVFGLFEQTTFNAAIRNYKYCAKTFSS